MKDIIDEVREDLKEETFSKIITKYGKYIISIILLIVGITAAYVYQENRYISKQRELSQQYYNAFLAGITKDQLPQELLKNKDNIYSNLAYFKKVSMLIETKEYKQAAGLLHSIIKDSDHIEIKNLAKIYLASIIKNYSIEDNKIISILRSSIGKKEPFNDLMTLSLAQLLIRDGKKEEAVKVLNELELENKSNSF